MRHRKKGKILDRKKASRKALLRNLAISLILYEKIRTTLAKAKALRPVVERLITLGKVSNLQTRRRLLQFLTAENAARKVLEVLGPRYKERKGGYTRIIRIKQRAGDAAEIAQIEFV